MRSFFAYAWTYAHNNGRVVAIVTAMALVAIAAHASLAAAAFGAAGGAIACAVFAPKTIP